MIGFVLMSISRGMIRVSHGALRLGALLFLVLMLPSLNIDVPFAGKTTV
jgi:hypothetical protein